MDWLLEHLQLVILAGLGLAGWLKTRYDAQQAESDESGTDFPTQPPAMPRPFVPPPLERSTRQPPPLRSTSPAIPAAAQDFSEELRRQQEIEDRLRAIRASRSNKAVSTGGAVATRARIAARGKEQTARPPITTLRQRLHNRAEIRAAIVLREILDRPVGLR